MALWINQFFNGLGYVGPILLLAVGLSTPLAAVRVLNCSVGGVFAFTALSGILVATHVGTAGFVAVCFATPIVLALGSELLVLRPQRNRVLDPEMGSFAATLGLGFVITAVAALISHSDNLVLPPNMLRLDKVFIIGKIQITLMSLVVFGAAVLAALTWAAVLRFTSVGKLFRALAINPYLAAVSGIRTEWIALQAWALSGLFTATATFLILMSSRFANAESGSIYLLTPFAAVIAGGMGSLGGTVIASVFFGLAQSLAVAATPWPGIQDALIFGVLFAILVIRPRGIVTQAIASRDY